MRCQRLSRATLSLYAKRTNPIEISVSAALGALAAPSMPVAVSTAPRRWAGGLLLLISLLLGLGRAFLNQPLSVRASISLANISSSSRALLALPLLASFLSSPPYSSKPVHAPSPVYPSRHALQQVAPAVPPDGTLSLTSERGVALLKFRIQKRKENLRAAAAVDAAKAPTGVPVVRAAQLDHSAAVQTSARQSVTATQANANSDADTPLGPGMVQLQQIDDGATVPAVSAGAGFAPGQQNHAPSRLFEHFDSDSDGLLSEREVAALLKQLTRKRREEEAARAAAAAAVGESRAAGFHDVSIDGETLSVGDGDFDLLFKQLSNLKQTKDPSKDPRMTLQEDIVFVKDLVIVFTAATIGGVIATHFSQPPLIGFLLGGMTVGPGGLGIVTELVEVETLASLGIAFLLFSLGIEFSITELQSVRRVVVVGGIMSMFSIVIGTGALSLMLSLVKSVPEAVALGLAVSLSSTAVVLQCLPSAPSHAPSHGPPSTTNGNSLSPNGWAALDGARDESHDLKGSVIAANGSTRVTPSNLNVNGTSFDSARSRKVMLGLLVFQDVMIGLILALLPTLQGSLGQFAEELMSAVLRLGCFVMISLIMSEFVLPTLVDQLDRARSQEVFTIGCVVFCLAMSYLSERMGLAIELGAFAAGIMLSESRHKHRVEESIEGIRSIFSAVFFISVGMMIHWRYFYQNFIKMFILLGVILGTKAIVFAVVIFALGGLPLRTSIACGAAISQAGEFTFVIASKGQALLLFTSSEARMINGATALSMLISPYLIRYARSFALRGGGSSVPGRTSSSSGMSPSVSQA
jgi:Kef-type K+ transport system membrane component KefB